MLRRSRIGSGLVRRHLRKGVLELGNLGIDGILRLGRLGHEILLYFVKRLFLCLKFQPSRLVVVDKRPLKSVEGFFQFSDDRDRYRLLDGNLAITFYPNDPNPLAKVLNFLYVEQRRNNIFYPRKVKRLFVVWIVVYSKWNGDDIRSSTGKMSPCLFDEGRWVGEMFKDFSHDDRVKVLSRLEIHKVGRYEPKPITRRRVHLGQLPLGV